ncbi:MAG: hypothetical protein KAG26_05525 [Methylococcales bacterium]|nr:hypothetical protein [Methylococcales bacterium]
MKNLILSVATVAALSIGSYASAAGITLDNFDDPSKDMYEVEASSTLSQGSKAVSGVIGTHRTTKVDYVSGVLGGKAGVTDGFFSYSSDVATKIKSKITWDSNGVGLGGVDLTQGNALTDQGFRLNILEIDQGKIDLTFNLIDTNGDSDSVIISGLGEGLQYVLFSTFTNLALDFTSIDSISLGVTQLSSASDLAIDFFEVDGVPPSLTTPLPAAVFLFGSGLMGLVGFSKRKKIKEALSA